MTTGLAATVVNDFLDTAFGTVYVSLHTGDPGADGSSNAAAGDATLKQATMASASGGSKAMTGTAGPWTNDSATETISHIALRSAASEGDFLGSAALSASKAWADTDTFTLTSLSVSISPIAA